MKGRDCRLYRGRDGDRAATGTTHHSVEYSVPEIGKPRFEQYEAQTAGVICCELVLAEMRARPFVPSAMRLDEADLNPAGREAAGAGAADDDEAEAEAEALAEAPAPALGERSALSLAVL